MVFFSDVTIGKDGGDNDAVEREDGNVWFLAYGLLFNLCNDGTVGEEGGDNV